MEKRFNFKKSQEFNSAMSSSNSMNAGIGSNTTQMTLNGPKDSVTSYAGVGRSNSNINFQPKLKQISAPQKQNNGTSAEADGEVSPLSWGTILTNMSQSLDNGINPRYFVSPLRVLTGTVSQVLQWSIAFSGGVFYYEVFGYFVNAYNADIQKNELILMIIDRFKSQTSMEVIYFPFSNPPLPTLRQGMWLRCFGPINETHQMRAISIRSATDEELQSLQRVQHVCRHSITNM